MPHIQNPMRHYNTFQNKKSTKKTLCRTAPENFQPAGKTRRSNENRKQK